MPPVENTEQYAHRILVQLRAVEWFAVLAFQSASQFLGDFGFDRLGYSGLKIELDGPRYRYEYASTAVDLSYVKSFPITS